VAVVCEKGAAVGHWLLAFGFLCFKADSEMMYLERLTSVAEADFFNSNTAGMNACSTHLQDTATLELL
jgi:hypothetical protein